MVAIYYPQTDILGPIRNQTTTFRQRALYWSRIK